MPYCDIDVIKERLPESNLVHLTDDTSASQIDPEKVDEAIADADAIIDSHLSERYSVPLVSVPKLIKRLSADLAIYNLYSRKYDTEMPDAMRNRYKDAIAMLEKIASGRMHLPDVHGNNGPVTPETTRVTKTAEERLFGKGTLDQW